MTAWEEHVGPFYDTEQVQALLGGQVSSGAVRQRTLLRLTTGDGRVVFPAAQFRGSTVAPGLEQILDALPDPLTSPWTVASWLLSPDTDFGGERPMDVLFDGDARAVTAVVNAARRFANT